MAFALISDHAGLLSVWDFNVVIGERNKQSDISCYKEVVPVALMSMETSALGCSVVFWLWKRGLRLRGGGFVGEDDQKKKRCW